MRTLEIFSPNGVDVDSYATWHPSRKDYLLPLRETTVSPEVVQSIENMQEALHVHGYQPIRKERFADETTTIFDITMTDHPLESWTSPNQPIMGGVNAKVTAECYEPMLKYRILQNPLIGVHMYPSIIDWLKVKKPSVWEQTHTTLKEKAGFAGPPTQLALPTMPDILEDLAIDIGIEMHTQDYGEEPLAFWPPELLVNDKTLDKLAQKGIKVLILGRHQIETDEEAPLYYIHTQSGRLMFIFPYNNKLSHTVADNAGHIWADKLADEIQDEASYGVTTLTAVDEETIGHHHKQNSLRLTEYLINTELPNRIEKNQVSFKRTIDQAKPARLREGMTSWSCEHNGGRWTGECYCDGIDEEIRIEKQSLYQELFDQTCAIIENLNDLPEVTHESWQQEFMTWYIDQRYNIAAGEPINVKNVQQEYQNSFKLLLTAMFGLQSCTFFFKGDFEREVARKARNYIRSHQKQEVILAA